MDFLGYKVYWMPFGQQSTVSRRFEVRLVMSQAARGDRSPHEKETLRKLR